MGWFYALPQRGPDHRRDPRAGEHPGHLHVRRVREIEPGLGHGLRTALGVADALHRARSDRGGGHGRGRGPRVDDGLGAREGVPLEPRNRRGERRERTSPQRRARNGRQFPLPVEPTRSERFPVRDCRDPG
jgi:hypothetical protein